MRTIPATIDRGGIYSTPQVLGAMGISDKTLTLWTRNGLKAYRPGTNSMFFIGSEIIDFVIANPTLKDKSQKAPSRRGAK